MMAKNTRELLDQARRFHVDLSKLYAQSSALAGDERARALLDYVSRHQRLLEASLRTYEQTAGKSILDYWFQFTPEAPHCDLPEDPRLDPSMSVDALIDAILNWDDALIRFYRNLAATALTEEVRELFLQLMRLEQQEERITVRSANELQQL